MEESEAANSWKEMFLKALSSLKGLEKEIAHKDGEIQSLKNRIKISEIDQAIRPPPEPSESILNEMKDLKSKLNATEACLQEVLELNVKLEVSCGNSDSIIVNLFEVLGLALRFVRVLRWLTIFAFIRSHPDY